MKRKWTPYIIAVMVSVVFIVLGLACASAPESAVKYEEISPDSLYDYRMAYDGVKIVMETRIFWFMDDLGGYIFLQDAGAGDFAAVSVKNLNEISLKEKIETGKLYRVYMTKINGRFSVDRIDGLMSIEEAQARIEQRNAEEKAAEEAQRQKEEEQRQKNEVERQAREQARKAEQERLANLYRQAGNNFGNLRNTSRRFGMVFGNDYLTKIYNFGNGTYIAQIQSALGLRFSPDTGTYRVNGDTVIFLSSEGEYTAGTIIGTALNIDGDIYR